MEGMVEEVGRGREAGERRSEKREGSAIVFNTCSSAVATVNLCLNFGGDMPPIRLRNAMERSIHSRFDLTYPDLPPSRLT